MLGTPKDMQKRLWRWASLSIGAPFFGEPGGGLVYRDFERRMKGALGMGLLSLMRLRGGLRRGELRHWGPRRICSDNLRICALPMGDPTVPRESWCLGGEARLSGILKDG